MTSREELFLSGFAKFAGPNNTAFQLAQRDKSPEGLFKLGICLYRGDGCEADIDEALNALKKSAEAGHASAAYTVYLICDKEKDWIAANRFLEMAARNGHEEAKRLFGLGNT